MGVTITKEFNWAMSHLLENHDGLCKNLHGHNYKMFVTVSKSSTKKEIESNEGMVCDFKNLKKNINYIIIDKVDHTFMYNKNDVQSKMIAKFLKDLIKQKTFPVNFRITAENMSEWIYKQINLVFDLSNAGLKCEKIVLFETETSFATYEEKHNEN